jgi:hypothetical protein
MNTAVETPTPSLGPGAQAVRLAFWFVVVIALLAAGVAFRRTARLW